VPYAPGHANRLPGSTRATARDRRRALGTALAVLAVVAAVPLWVGERELADRPDVDQVALQLAGGRQAACRVLQPGAPGCPVAGDAVRRYRSAVQADGFQLAGWVLAGLGVFGLSALFPSGSGARRVARWCLGGNGGDNTWSRRRRRSRC